MPRLLERIRERLSKRPILGRLVGRKVTRLEPERPKPEKVVRLRRR